MSTESNPSIRVTRRFPFPAERVFDAWLNPALASKWLFATPTGEMVRVETDPRVGGRFVFVDRRNGEDVEHCGEYLELQRPSRLVFTFGVPKYSSDTATVIVEIVPTDDGCELTLIQERTKAEWVTRTREGWTQLTESLAATLGDQRAIINREPGRFVGSNEVSLVRLLPGPIERVWAYLTESEKRRTWFAGGSMELRVGGRVELLFRHENLAPGQTPPEKYREVQDPGVTMVGEVTQCDPPRLIAFTWEGDTPEEQSEVAFELTPEGDDVRLVLTHRRLASDKQRDVSGGWHLHLSMLIAKLAGNTPPVFWVAHERLEALYKSRLTTGNEAAKN